MKKDMPELNFEDVDYTKYSPQIKEIKKMVNNLTKDKKLMKKLKKYQTNQVCEIPTLNYQTNMLFKNQMTDYKNISGYKELLEYKNNKTINNADSKKEISFDKGSYKTISC